MFINSIFAAVSSSCLIADRKSLRSAISTEISETFPENWENKKYSTQGLIFHTRRESSYDASLLCDSLLLMLCSWKFSTATLKNTINPSAKLIKVSQAVTWSSNNDCAMLETGARLNYCTSQVLWQDNLSIRNSREAFSICCIFLWEVLSLSHLFWTKTSSFSRKKCHTRHQLLCDASLGGSLFPEKKHRSCWVEI